MKVRVATTPAEAAALEPHWAALAAGRPFLGPAWMAVWWRHFGKPAREPGFGSLLAIVSVTDHAGRIVAIAPWYLETSLLHGRTLRFLGSGEVCTEYPTLLCEPGEESGAIAAIADWLGGISAPDTAADAPPVWDSLSFTGIDAADRPIEQLSEALAVRGAVVHIRPADQCWRLDLPADWESYLAMLSKSHRKRVRRLDRTYFESGRARCRVVRSADELAHGYQVFTDLHAKRWSVLGESGMYRRPEIHAFHRAAVERLLTAGELRLSWLELDGRPVAAEYSLQGNGVIYAYQAGMDPAAAEHEPGSLSLIATLKEAIAEGMKAIDFLRGDEPYKQHWRAEPRPTRELRIVADRLPCRLRHNLGQAAAQAKSWLRNGRNAVLTRVPFARRTRRVRSEVPA
jgi:CelD/BcsL family acetyltransferase involved in cellulose biosynthesis